MTETKQTTKVRKPRNHAIRMAREAAGQDIFDRNLRKERAIGVHPKFLHSYRRQWSAPAKAWEALSRDWDKANLAASLSEAR